MRHQLRIQASPPYRENFKFFLMVVFTAPFAAPLAYGIVFRNHSVSLHFLLSYACAALVYFLLVIVRKDAKRVKYRIQYGLKGCLASLLVCWRNPTPEDGRDWWTIALEIVLMIALVVIGVPLMACLGLLMSLFWPVRLPELICEKIAPAE